MGCGCYVTGPHLATAPQLQVWYPASPAPGPYPSPGRDTSLKSLAKISSSAMSCPRCSREQMQSSFLFCVTPVVTAELKRMFTVIVLRNHTRVLSTGVSE